VPVVLSFTVEDVAELTVGELEFLEERCGRSLSQLFAPDAPRGTLLHALAYLKLRRDDPAITWEEAADVRVELAEEAPAVVASTSNGAHPTPRGATKRRA
jgi:hypothetical protein